MAEPRSSGGTGDKWRKGAACALIWALESLPEELWARGVVCPAERAVMLRATSRRVRALLARMQRRLPAAVRVVEIASMDAVAGGLGRLQGWCQVMRLDLNRGQGTGAAPIGARWAGMLAEVLGQCSALTVLNLQHRMIGAEGVGSLAGLLGQCSSLTKLNLAGNGIGDEGAGMLAGVLGQCSSLATLSLQWNRIGAEGAGMLAGVLGQCSSLTKLDLSRNDIDDDGIAMLRKCWPGDSGLEIDDQF